MHDFIKNTNSAKMSNITPTFGLCQKYANARKIRFLRTVFDLSLVESWFISIICEKRITPCSSTRQSLLLVLMTQETSHRILFIFHFDISHFIH